MVNMGSIVFSLALVLSIQFMAGHDEQAKDESALSKLIFIDAVVENAKEIDVKEIDSKSADDIKGMGKEIQKTLESKGVNDKDLDEAFTLAQDEDAIENGIPVTMGDVRAPEPSVAEEMGGVGAPEPNVEEIAPSPDVSPELAADAADVPEEDL